MSEHKQRYLPSWNVGKLRSFCRHAPHKLEEARITLLRRGWLPDFEHKFQASLEPIAVANCEILGHVQTELSSVSSRRSKL